MAPLLCPAQSLNRMIGLGFQRWFRHALINSGAPGTAPLLQPAHDTLSGSSSAYLLEMRVTAEARLAGQRGMAALLQPRQGVALPANNLQGRHCGACVWQSAGQARALDAVSWVRPV